MTGNAQPGAGRSVGLAGKALIKKWEGCARRRADGMIEAYPDPGSADGRPWTIGWGLTGPDIGPHTVWTQVECDARFDREIERYAADVVRAVGGAATSQNQFDALVSFQYNTGKLANSTLLALHRQGKYERAWSEFGKWIHNDGKVMPGLVSRRGEEATLYVAPPQ